MSAPLSLKALALASAVGALCAWQPALAANIVDTAKADGHFTKLLEANQAAGTAALLTQPGPFTVFAPNDDAFAKVPADKLQALMTPAMQTMLKVTLGNHIVTGVLDMSAIESALGKGDARRRDGREQHAAHLQDGGRQAHRQRRPRHQGPHDRRQRDRLCHRHRDDAGRSDASPLLKARFHVITDTLSTPVARATSAPVVVVEGSHLAAWGARATRYSLIVVFLWFGMLKFTDYEASAIAPLVMNSPLVMWLNGLFGIGGTAHFLGVFEILTALLIASRRWQPRLAVVGGAMAVLTFLITLSFMFSTPGVVQSGFDGPMALSPMPGQFLLKDLVLLCVSFWVAASAYEEARLRR